MVVVVLVFRVVSVVGRPGRRGRLRAFINFPAQPKLERKVR